jgi:hypothetical protein
MVNQSASLYAGLALSILLYVSCGHTYDNSKELTEAFKKRGNQKSDTLIVQSMACTECSDFYIYDGELTVPPDITHLRTRSDIKVCGNFPIDLLDVSSINFDPDPSFKIIGKVIKVNTNGGSDKIPLFYVESWEKCYVDKTLLKLKKQFTHAFKQWTSTFNNFDLFSFEALDTIPFENGFEQNMDNYKDFLSIHEPIITYSQDSSRFIDIYSHQLNLQKKGNNYYANPDIDQAILLCIPQKKYWNKIYSGTSLQWIDEVLWLTDTNFILAGILKSKDQKNTPLILLGDTDKEELILYVSNNKSCFQNDLGYSSPKLKNIKIEGL